MNTEDKYLFFDTETTGLPLYREVTADVMPQSWPRLVQLGMILTDSWGEILEEESMYVIPDGFEIPEEAVAIHGISTEFARENGEPLNLVLDKFQAFLRNAKYVVGHNVWFDVNVISGELLRTGNDPAPLLQKPGYCTMMSGTELCALEFEDGRGYKWPKLQELYKELFHRG